MAAQRSLLLIITITVVLFAPSVSSFSPAGPNAQRGPDLTSKVSESLQGKLVKFRYAASVPSITRSESERRAKLEHSQVALEENKAINAATAIVGPTAGETHGIAVPAVTPSGPDAFKILRDSVLVPDGAQDNNEPSLANNNNTVFYTGNKYAARSTDGGVSWSYIDPYKDFPNFCCDQDVIYDKTNDLLFWFRLGEISPAILSEFKLGVSGNGGESFCFWNFHPTDFERIEPSWKMVGWDYPHLAPSNNYLYLTLNAYKPGGGLYRSILARAPLDSFKSCGKLEWTYWMQDAAASFGCSVDPSKVISPTVWTPVQGAKQTMYVGQTTTNDCFTVWRQNESNTTLEQYRIEVPAWTVSQIDASGSSNMKCEVPNGEGDPCFKLGHRVMAGWVAKGKVGFFWDAASGNGFLQPYVNAATFNSRTLSYQGRPYIWNRDYAWVWAAAYPNERGDLGIATWKIGKGTNPELFVGLDDQVNGDPPPWEMKLVAASTTGPRSNNWGHYLRVRPHSPNELVWIVGGFVSVERNNVRGLPEPHFAIFGRAGDEASIKPKLSKGGQ